MQVFRGLAALAAAVAAVLFVISAVVNVTTGNPLHYISWGLVLLAAAVALFIVSTLNEVRAP